MATSPEKISIPASDLVSKMKGQDCLKGWDILVAYDEKSINEMLAERIKEMPGILDGKHVFDIPVDDGFEVNNWKFTLNYHPPLMQFNSADYTINLTFDITGDYTKNSLKPREFPKGLQLQLTTKLCYVTGAVVDGKDPKHEGESKTGRTESGGIAIDFKPAKDDNNYQYHKVALDFSNVNAKFIHPPADDGSTSKEAAERARFLNTSASSLIEQEFQKEAGVRFYLVGLSNKQVTNVSGDAKVLTPERFAVTLIGNKGEPGALCMWIQCQGRPKQGRPDSGNDPLKFAPHSTEGQVSPIPEGATAAVVLSHDCMWDTFIKPGLTSSNFSNPKVTSRLGIAGMEFEATLPPQTVNIPGFHNDIGRNKENSDDVTFNVNDSPIKFQFKPDFSSPSITYSYELKLKDYEIRTAHVSIGIGGSSSVTRENIKVAITFKTSGSGSWAITKAKDAQNQIELPFSPTTGMEAEVEKTTTGFMSWTTFTDHFKDHVKGVHLPPVTVSIGHLDYFLATNLLFPGEKLFYAKDQSSGAAGATGIATPRDTIIVGDIAGKQK